MSKSTPRLSAMAERLRGDLHDLRIALDRAATQIQMRYRPGEAQSADLEDVAAKTARRLRAFRDELAGDVPPVYVSLWTTAPRGLDHPHPYTIELDPTVGFAWGGSAVRKVAVDPGSVARQMSDYRDGGYMCVDEDGWAVSILGGRVVSIDDGPTRAQSAKALPAALRGLEATLTALPEEGDAHEAVTFAIRAVREALRLRPTDKPRDRTSDGNGAQPVAIVSSPYTHHLPLTCDACRGVIQPGHPYRAIRDRGVVDLEACQTVHDDEGCIRAAMEDETVAKGVR